MAVLIVKDFVNERFRKLYAILGRYVSRRAIRVEIKLTTNELVVSIQPAEDFDDVVIKEVQLLSISGVFSRGQRLSSKWLETELLSLGYFTEPLDVDELNQPGIYKARFVGGASALSRQTILNHFKLRDYSLWISYTVEGIDQSFFRKVPLLIPE
jgi:hypothetical protein